MTADDVLRVLRAMQPRHRQYVLSVLGLRVVATVNRGMAAQMLARLRADHPAAHSDLLGNITAPVSVALDAGADPGQWTALLGSDPRLALNVYADNRALAGSLEAAVRDLSPRLLTAGLTVAITKDTAAAAAALAVLAREHDSARATYQHLSESYPELPPIPAAPLSELVQPARLAALGVTNTNISGEDLADLLDELPNGPDDAAVLAQEVDSPVEENPASAVLASADQSSPAQRAQALLTEWDAACAAADAVANALKEGRFPAAGDVARIAKHAETGLTVLDDLHSVLGEAIPGTRDALLSAVETLTQRAQAAADIIWLRRLAGIEGPQGIDGAVAEVRESATAAISAPAAPRGHLAALWALFELTEAARGGATVDFAVLSETQTAAQVAWPTAGPLIAAIAYGAVTVPNQESTTEPVVEVPESGVERVPPAEPSEPVATPEPSVQSTGPGVLDGTGPEMATLAEGASDLPTEDPGSGLVPSTNSGDAELADLDALLKAGAGATLAAVSNPRRRSTASAVHDTTLEDAGVATPTGFAPSRPTEVESTGTVDRVGAAALLPAGRFGLAADLLEASGASAPSVAARRLAAYAAALTSPTGRLATAFAELAPVVSREALGEDRAGQLVALTAAGRIALLAPSAGPATVLLELLPCVSEQPALTESLTALADASRAGIVVLAEAADAVGTLAAAENAAAEAASDAAGLLSGATRRTIKYIPANGVYQAWMSPEGELGTLLALVATNNPDTLTSVRDKVVALRGRAHKAIDSTFAAQRRNRSNRIIAGARSTLLTRWEEAIELAARWAELTERTTERQVTVATGAWQAGPLTTMRHRIAGVREQAVAELAAQSGKDPDTTAAVEAAGQLLADAFAICDGAAPDSDELPVAFAAHAELLATPLALEANTLLPAGGLSAEHVPALLAVAGTDPADPVDMYTHRAERGDHDLTATLITGVRTSDPTSAAALERRRGSDIAEQAADVADEVTAMARLIDTRRLAGTLDDQPWAALAARAEALADPARRDFGRIRATVAEITADLNALVDNKITATLARIEERARSNQAVAEAAEVLTGLTRDGQVASAEEYLETALTGGALPAASRGVDHLEKYFPAVPQLAIERPNLLDELHAAFSRGPANVSVASLDAAGLNLADLSQARCDAGRRALGCWKALAGHEGAGARKADITTALQAVLAQAGLEFTGAKMDQSSTRQTGRQWIRLSGVTGTGQALTPTLGSAMSPDGATLRVLLVRSAPTPTTLIEWMSGETPDHTVLALWLSGALSPTDRRAIANAARGRPTPPLLVLDTAALAYLVCQPEPRRSTFAATALPFTAASPYRDTPGDTPPEMFYGRTDELAAVVDLNGPSFVSGGRQLGKSALLRVAARRFEASGPRRHAVLTSVFTVGGDGRPERLWDALWPHLARIGIVTETVLAKDVDIAQVVYDSVLRWLDDDPTRALLILLDEADAFLDADAAGVRFTHVDWCRRLMLDTSRRVKVVFAGLHRTARFESLPNQPLSHLGRPISVGPLRPQHAHDLLTEPLAALGFTFAEPIALPARILAMANNMPALLQLFGEALVKHLASRSVPADGPPQRITDADVDEVFADADLRAAFREKYVLTLNLDHRYLVIAYAVAEAAHERGIDTSLGLSELSEIARLHWPAGFSGVSADDFRGLVAECVDLGVLAIDGGSYRLRTPTVLRLLGTEEEVLETLYTASERLVVPSPSDAGSYRRRVGHARSPLTERQLGRLFDARREVLTVTGSLALGVDAVLTAVEAAAAEGARLTTVNRARTVTPDGVRAAVARAAANTTLLLVDALALTPVALTALLATAEEAVAAAWLDVTVAVIVSPANASAWITRASRVDLIRVDEPGLRMWCDEDNLPFRDDESRARLLAVTGGWPQAITQAKRLTESAGAAIGSGKLLGDLTAWLSGREGHKLPARAGLGPETTMLAQVFHSVVALVGASGEDPHELVELLELDDRVDLTAMAVDAGFGSLDDVIAVLATLGCLTVTSTGRLRPELTLAALVTGAPVGAEV
ncbi:hypothetical protein [Crossiella cryophila]|uniref:AAA domain-containing protein n=1 Tax=Crossiella cryophila TaxID=43355 RepID=A0A7W7FUD5_9PSEU|nr:hypothetical protein [Crossiella cryophila]MBB4675669.1 hypothetical protein [Crossiella cryophila]